MAALRKDMKKRGRTDGWRGYHNGHAMEASAVKDHPYMMFAKFLTLLNQGSALLSTKINSFANFRAVGKIGLPLRLVVGVAKEGLMPTNQ